MTTTEMFAASAAALIVACVAGWAVTDTQARTPAPMAQIDTFNVMTSAQQLPTEHFADYSFVF
jgi:hypothetical protein